MGFRDDGRVENRDMGIIERMEHVSPVARAQTWLNIALSSLGISISDCF